MNVPFPGEGEPWGMATATALSAGAALVLFRVFRRRSWL
jgi:Mg2+ and Co2+ transporter CorA